MQSMDENGNVKGMTPVDFDNLNDLVAKIRTAQESGAKSHVIGELPAAGENVTINGLSYRVEFADYVKGKYNVKLVLRDK